MGGIFSISLFLSRLQFLDFILLLESDRPGTTPPCSSSAMYWWVDSIILVCGSLLVVISLVDELLEAYVSAYEDYLEHHDKEERTSTPDTDSDPCSIKRCEHGVKELYQRNLKGIVPFVIHFCLAMVMTFIVFYIVIADPSYYQERVKGVSGATINVYGAGIANDRGQNWKVWDANDVAVPAEENTEFFFTTKRVKTRNQTRGVCPERTMIKQARCRNDLDCLPVGTALGLTAGVTNGTCNADTGTCFVHAWCPVEYDMSHSKADVEILNGAGDFLVLIKNHVYFEFSDGFGTGHSNIAGSTYRSNEEHCTYDEVTDQTCPYFRVSDLVTMASSKAKANSTFREFAAEGGVISIRIKWRCDVNADIRNCQPTYHFRRLDRDRERLVASGYNYTDVIRSYDDENKRDLIRATGFLFIIAVDAIGSRFSSAQLATKIGVAFALMRSARVLKSFIIMLYALGISIYYRFCCIEKKAKTPEEIELRAINGDDVAARPSANASPH